MSTRQAIVTAGTILTVLLFTHSAISAANLYVRPDGGSYGAEDGSDWGNAFDGMGDVGWGAGPGQAGAGDTLFIASGTYTSHLVVGADGSEGNLLVIRRATVRTHGTDAGWESGFDGLTELVGAYVDLRNRSFIDLDGVTEYGIRQSGLNGDNGIVKYIWIGAYTGQGHYSEHLTIRNMELIGPGRLTCDHTAGIGVYAYYGRVDNLVIRNIKAHEFSGACIRLGDHDGVLIENCRIYNVQNASYSACNGNNPHNTHIAMYGSQQNDNVVIRNNYLYQEADDDTVDGGYTLGFGYVSGNVDIYNNVFFNICNPALTAENPMPTVPGTEINFFNNTFIGFRHISWTGDGTFNFMNNIFSNEGFVGYSTRWPYTTSQAVLDSCNMFYRDPRYYTRYDNGSNYILPAGVNPFEDYENDDLELKCRLRDDSPGRGAGKDLGYLFDTDLNGVTRPAGNWDVGAFQYAESNVKLRSAEYGIRYVTSRVFNPWVPESGYQIRDTKGAPVTGRGIGSGIFFIRKTDSEHWQRVVIRK